MYTIKEIRKASKRTIEGNEIRVAVLGNCATQFFSTAISGYAKLSKLNVHVYDTDYNQIEMQLLNKGSEVYLFRPDNILLWFSTDKLYEEFLDLPLNQKSGFAEYYINRIINCWNLIRQNSNARVIQPNFTEIDDKAFGQYSCKVENSFIYQVRKMNYLLEEAMRSCNYVYPVDFLAVQIQLGQEKFYDAPLYYNAKVTVAINALPYIAKSVVDVLLAISGQIKKCVVLDLDNTLWGGVIGDDGLNNIEIGELGRGHVFVNFQRWLKQLKECGIILTVCSKNNEDVAKEPFEKHPDMILRLSDISVFVANWNDKASNIRLIQESLNIGLDSMVFLDDNPFERELVRKLIPEIEVPELPEDPALYLGFLQQCDYFNTVSYTGQNADRTELYQAEYERRKLESSFESIDDYLISLEMFGTAKPFDSTQFSRIAQLTQRSNQFNLRTIRYTENEIEKIAADEKYITLYFTLRDRFGDHGLISVVIMEKRSKIELFIDTWLMSCRVLKRGMEEFILNRVVEVARKNGFETIAAEYIPTTKNKMVQDIYDVMGFEKISDYNYNIEIDKYQERKTYISEEIQ